LNPDTNWEAAKSLLIDRIRRRALALQRLSSAGIDHEAIIAEIDTCGDDAKALWALAERVDRALDLAMAPRASRLPLPASNEAPQTHDRTTLTRSGPFRTGA
jgi:hypothetical protein